MSKKFYENLTKKVEKAKLRESKIKNINEDNFIYIVDDGSSFSSLKEALEWVKSEDGINGDVIIKEQIDCDDDELELCESKVVWTRENGELKEELLKEGTANFYTPKYLPLLIFIDYDEVVYDMIHDEDYPNIDDFDDPDKYDEARYDFEDEYLDKFEYCILDESEIDKLRNELDDFNIETKEIAEDKDIDEEGYQQYSNNLNLEDITLTLKPGYYSGVQIDVANEDSFDYLDEDFKEEQLERFNKFLKELKEKYGLTELQREYTFSNGETGYSKVESLKESFEEIYIKYWENEDLRDQGISEIYRDNFATREEAIEVARKLVDRDGYASVEVFVSPSGTLESEDDKLIWGYDGNECWGGKCQESLKEDLEHDYSNIDLIDKFEFKNRRTNNVVGISNMRDFIDSLNKVGKDTFKCRTSTFGNNVSWGDIKDSLPEIMRNGWRIGRAWDSSLSGFNEVYICQKESLKEEKEEDYIYYIVSDGKNPRHSIAFTKNQEEDALRIAPKYKANYGYVEVLKYTNGKSEVILKNEEVEPVEIKRPKGFAGHKDSEIKKDVKTNPIEEDKSSNKEYTVEVLYSEDGNHVTSFKVKSSKNYDSSKILNKFFKEHPNYKDDMYKVQITESLIESWEIPDDVTPTGETIKSPRIGDEIQVVKETKDELRKKGFGYYHNVDSYAIMTKNTGKGEHSKYIVACKDSINESIKEDKYIYLFPDSPAMGDYKDDCKKFNLEFLGKNYYGIEKNLVIRGTEKDLRKYAEYLDYDLHPDYLYKEEDFAGEILPLKDKKVREGYSLLGAEDKNIELYSNYYTAKKRAEELGLKLAEYGDLYNSDICYCYWNKSGNRFDDEEVICYYFYENGKPKHSVSQEELNCIAREIGLSVKDIDDADDAELEDETEEELEESCSKNTKKSNLNEDYSGFLGNYGFDYLRGIGDFEYWYFKDEKGFEEAVERIRKEYPKLIVSSSSSDKTIYIQKSKYGTKEPVTESKKEVKPFTKSQVMAEIKRDTVNFSKDFEGHYGFEEEANIAEKILTKRGYDVDYHTEDSKLEKGKTEYIIVATKNHVNESLEEDDVEYKGFTIKPLVIDSIIYGDKKLPGFTKYTIMKGDKYLPDEVYDLFKKDNKLETIDDYKKLIDNIKIKEDYSEDYYDDDYKKLLKRIAKSLKMPYRPESEDDYDNWNYVSLLHDCNNGRGNEWIEIFEEENLDKSLLKEFKRLLRCISKDEDFILEENKKNKTKKRTRFVGDMNAEMKFFNDSVGNTSLGGTSGE